MVRHNNTLNVLFSPHLHREQGNSPTMGYHMVAAVSSSNRWTSLQQFINFLPLSFTSSLPPNHKSQGVRPGQRDKKLSGSALAHFCRGNKTTLRGSCALERATGNKSERNCVNTSNGIRTRIFPLLQYIQQSGRIKGKVFCHEEIDVCQMSNKSHLFLRWSMRAGLWSDQTRGSGSESKRLTPEHVIYRQKFSALHCLSS